VKSETELHLYGCQWNCYSIQTVKMLHFWHHFSNVPLGSSQSTNCLLVLSPLSTLGGVVGIATGYGLDGPGIESRWGRIFRTCPARPWGPPSLLYNGYWVFPGGKERPGRDADPSHLIVPLVIKEWSYTSTPPTDRTACTEPQCLYKGALYLTFYLANDIIQTAQSRIH
jgi:hypothetical protein